MKKINILYEDKYLIVVNKPHNKLMIRKDNKMGNNLYDEVKEYIKKQNPHNKLFIVHRLDKETSGIVVFAKTIEVKNILQRNWQNVKRYYYALVEGKLDKLEGSIVNYLKEDKYLNVYITNKKDGKIAITNYKVIKEFKNESILDIEIKTGRKHQIRVGLSNIGHPIVGDKKYGNGKNIMCLQAYRIIFKHPITNKEINISTKMEFIVVK